MTQIKFFSKKRHEHACFHVRTKDTFLFHMGTSKKDGTFVTNGGRVLAVSALGNTLEDAVQKAYRAVSMIHFEGAYYRKDIAHRALVKEESSCQNRS